MELETILLKLKICKEKGYKHMYKQNLHDLLLYYPTHYHKMMGTYKPPENITVESKNNDDVLVGGVLGLGVGLLLGDIFD